MEILGIGGFEVALVIIIAIVVAGPARMAVWARTMGRWVAKMRQLWSVTAAQLQRELDDAGVDFKVPREIPTRRAIVQELSRSSTVSELRKPIDDIQSALKEGQTAMTEVTSAVRGVKTEVQTASAELRASTGNGANRTPRNETDSAARFKAMRPAPLKPNKPAASAPAEDFGTWGGQHTADAGADFGTWGAATQGEEQD